MAELSKDAQQYFKNKQFLQDLFSTVTDQTLPNIIKHFQKLEDQLSQEKQEQRSTLKEVLIGCKDGKGKSAIHFAAARGDQKIFAHLISEGCDINQVDNEGNNAFFTGVSHYHVDLVRYLVEELKVDVNQKRNDDQQALHISCSNGDFKMCEYLISKGADVNQTSSYGKPINWAAATQQVPILKLLLENKACPNGDKKQIPPPIILATDFGSQEIFDLLINYGADINITYDDYSVLHVAAEKGHMNLIHILIEKGANTEYEAKGMTAIELAKKSSQSEVVAFLRKHTKKAISQQVENEIEEQKKREEEEEKKKKAELESKPLTEEEKKALELQKEQDVKLALEKKELGNQHFQKEEFEQSLSFYEEAVKLDPSNIVYYSNKAAAEIKLKKCQEALATCQQGRKVNDQWSKILFREGQAYTDLEMYGDAAASYWEAMKIEPDSKLYKNLFDRSIALGKKQFKEQAKNNKQ